MSEHVTPAYRLETRQLVLRCWNPSDAPALRRSIAESLEHLRPTMAWAHEPDESVEVTAGRLRTFRAKFDRDEDYIFGIFPRGDEARVAGGTGLHPRIGREALEIGYWIHAGFTRRGYATEAAAALTRAAFDVHRVRRVEIHCLPENAASAAVARTLGFRHEATLARRTVRGDGSWGDQMVWTMFADQFPASHAATFESRAFDAVGRPLF